MPIYEYLCDHCHRVYSFMHGTMAGAKTPACPRCRRGVMTRQISRFAFVRGGTDPFAAIPVQDGDRKSGEPERDPDLYFAWRQKGREKRRPKDKD